MKLLYIILLILLIGCAKDGGTNMTTAVFETNKGNFEIELFTDKAPITTKNFIDLTNKGFYNNWRKLNKFIGRNLHRGSEEYLCLGLQYYK